MDIKDVLEQFDQQQRIAIELPGVRKEAFPNLVRFVRPPPGMNFVQYSRLDEAALDTTIAEQIAYFAPMNQPFEWIVYDHDQPPILKERLVAHGFAPDEPAALMALEASPMSRPIVAAHGFQLLTMTESYGWNGSGDDRVTR